MKRIPKPRTGGQILVDALRLNAVERVFCVPGESYLAVLDALHDAREQIDLVVCRQEGGAAYMAEAHGKLTGKPGVCFVTRGPGATNASVGVHTAFQDSTPMLLFIGQVARDQQTREAFQEIDYRQMYAPLAKWVVQIDDPRRLPELLAQAFQRAISGRPGPVVVVLPEDMLTESVAVTDAQPSQTINSQPGGAQLAQMQALLAEAERPLLILGGGGWDATAVAAIRRFAENQRLPVALSFRRQDLFDNGHAQYAGDLGLAASAELVQAIKDADLLLVVGSRLGEVTSSGYSLLDIPTPRQRLIHVHAGLEELGRVYQPTLAIASGMAAFACQAAELPAVPSERHGDWIAQLNQAYRGNLKCPSSPGAVQMGEIIAWLREHLPEDAILCNGAGNYAIWLHRFYQYRHFRSQLAPTNGSMGYGVPAAIAAALAAPGRRVLSFAGDGCFMMNGQELATAIQHDARVIFIVVNNGMYGTIRMHQERHYPGRVSGTALHNPDFAALARAYGLHAEVVQTTAEFAGAFVRAEQAGKAALIEIRVDPQALTPRQSLDQIRAQALQSQSSE
nr:thiamine pyrophosphate-binding protein [uncultured Pseudomonas sp.]